MRLLESLIVDALLYKVTYEVFLFLLDSIVFSLDQIKLIAVIFIFMLKIGNLLFEHPPFLFLFIYLTLDFISSGPSFFNFLAFIFRLKQCAFEAIVDVLQILWQLSQ